MAPEFFALHLLGHSSSMQDTSSQHGPTPFLEETIRLLFREELAPPLAELVARIDDLEGDLLEALSEPEKPSATAPMLSVADVADLFAVSSKTVRRRVVEGTFPEPVRVGGQLRFHPDEIEALRRGSEECQRKMKRGQRG